ncbi:MAG: antibiotic biosynthesis monooxygenase [Cycloclasticus sp.]
MSTAVILELNVSLDNRDELMATLEAILPDTRAYQGCQSILVTCNEANPCHIFLLEKWDSRADHERYVAWRAERGDLDKLGALLAAPPQSTYLETIDI